MNSDDKRSPRSLGYKELKAKYAAMSDPELIKAVESSQAEIERLRKEQTRREAALRPFLEQVGLEALPTVLVFTEDRRLQLDKIVDEPVDATRSAMEHLIEDAGTTWTEYVEAALPLSEALRAFPVLYSEYKKRQRKKGAEGQVLSENYSLTPLQAEGNDRD